jgi:truncated hemoglobin YjbI/ankyrin repeat protein
MVDGREIGDEAAVRSIAQRLYDGIEGDRNLRAKFGSDLELERHKLGAFLVEFFGGEPEWSRKYSIQYLGGAHRIVHITAADAARWLGHARRAVTEVASEQVATRVIEALRPVAHALVNEDAPAQRGARREGRYQPTRDAVTACGRGDLEAVVSLLEEHPHLVAPADPGSAELVFAAASRGRVPVLRALIEHGANVNKPAQPEYGLMRTPLCGARAKRKQEAVAVLLAAGAMDDVFTAAFLGDVESLRAALASDASLANEPDPASDFYRATVVDHAVRGRAPDATLNLLTDHGARSPDHGHHLLAHAACAGRAEVVSTLLEIGADASFVPPGRWILDDACAALLLDAGTDVNHAPTRWQSWIWRSCTGNHGNKDDPAYVNALLDAGAHVHARAFGKTALHFAAKAGFAGVTATLLARGADPAAVDDDGLTPLDVALASRNRPGREREAVIALLTRATAAKLPGRTP